MAKFRRNYGVYSCPHVFKRQRPVLLVVRDPEGDWQFLCGHEDTEDDEGCHLVGVGHLLDNDGSLEFVADLDIGTFAERENTASEWSIGELDD